MDKLKMKSLDLAGENIQKIEELFPSCIVESKDESGKLTKAIDFELLKQELSSDLAEGNKERYQLNWPGKKEALLTANTPIEKTLRPCREESLDFDTTQNLYIEGDNLDALKLLQETYLGKVKMIYIDPPYNTGKDFIYKDKFKSSIKKELEDSGQIDEEGNRLVANTDANGRFHSDWLSMMYPRLKLARNLLRDDGVIFISIDDNEVHNLRKICDEIFGGENFIDCICWNKRIPKNDKGIGSIHEYILIYVKDISYNHVFTMDKQGLEEIDHLITKLKNKWVPLPKAEAEIKKLYKKRGYDRGITLYNSLSENYELWGKINMGWPSVHTFGPRYQILHPKTQKPVKIPDRGWRWKKETFDKHLDIKNIIKLHDGSFLCGKIWFDKDENTQPSSVKYLKEVNKFLLRTILSLKSDGGISVENLFDNKSIYSYPKPVPLIKILINSIIFEDNDIVLDFFAGSATTSHAIYEKNLEDGGSRKYICIQLPEPCDEKSEAYKAGYKTISDIGKERIRRAGKKIKEAINNKTKQKSLTEDNSKNERNLDVGFRVLKVDSTNMKNVYYRPDKLGQQSLDGLISNIKEGRTEEDLLFQVLVDWGVDLSLPIKKEKISGLGVFFVDGNALAACFAERGKVTEELCFEIAKKKPLRAVFRDAGFESDSAKINIEQIFKSKSPGTELKVI